jgi:hypothetical protein
MVLFLQGMVYSLQFVCLFLIIWFFIFHPADDDAKSEFSFFPTCQVRVLRFYQSWPAASASCPPPRQLQAPELSGHCRTSTERQMSVALPDLNGERQMSDRMSQQMPDKISEYKYIYINKYIYIYSTYIYIR